MMNLSALFVLCICLPRCLSFSPSFSRAVQFKSRTTVTSMSSGIPDFSEEPMDPQRRIQSQNKIYNPDYVEERGEREQREREESSQQGLMMEKKEVSNTKLLEPTFDDMKQMAFILANITEHLDTNPELSMTVISKNMGWLFMRNIPALTQMILQEFPAFRQDEGMMRAYSFMMEFLVSVATETASLQKNNQNALRLLLEAAKISEQKMDAVITENREQFLKQEFLIYLDSEIEGLEANSKLENILVTVKLRIIDEIGKEMGVDVTILPKLAAEEDPAEMRRKTKAHLSDYDNEGKELFLQALRLMRVEMMKKYTQVDPILLMNLREVEKITESLIKSPESN